MIWSRGEQKGALGSIRLHLVIGLAIVVVYYRNRGSIAVDDVNMMKG